MSSILCVRFPAPLLFNTCDIFPCSTKRLLSCSEILQCHLMACTQYRMCPITIALPHTRGMRDVCVFVQTCLEQGWSWYWILYLTARKLFASLENYTRLNFRTPAHHLIKEIVIITINDCLPNYGKPMDAVRVQLFWLSDQESSEPLIQMIFVIKRLPQHGTGVGKKNGVVSGGRVSAVRQVG